MSWEIASCVAAGMLGGVVFWVLLVATVIYWDWRDARRELDD
jgi:hypothetical protein